jgi:hypothetical protein
MRTFKQISTGTIVGCSLKCMFTFFAKHPDFAEIYPPTVTPDYFLVRNPFDRTLDLFMDKLRSRAALDGPQQVCQTVLMDLLGLKQRGDLAGMSFQRFCSVLPQAAKIEEHMWPQSNGFFGHNREDANKLTRVTRIETGLSRLGLGLGIDFSVKVNAPECGHWTKYYDADSLYVVKEVYRQDFVMFGY